MEVSGANCSSFSVKIKVIFAHLIITQEFLLEAKWITVDPYMRYVVVYVFAKFTVEPSCNLYRFLSPTAGTAMPGAQVGKYSPILKFCIIMPVSKSFTE